MKKLIAMLLGVMMVFSAVAVSADSAVQNDEIGKLTESIISSFNEKNYEKMLEYTADSMKTDLYDLLLGEHSGEYKGDNIGFWAIDSMELIKYKIIKNDAVPAEWVNYDDYKMYSDVVTEYANIDIKTLKGDTEDIHGGSNFFVLVFGRNDSNADYKLLQWSKPALFELENIEFAFGDEGTGKNDEQINKIEKLKKYGIVNCYDDGNFYPENNITRAEFCKMTAAALGENFSELVAPSEKFADVPVEHWANEYINFCYDKGLVQGVTPVEKIYFVDLDENGNEIGKTEAFFRDDLADLYGTDPNLPKVYFEPDENVTFGDAAKILVCALGYEEVAQQRGGYPSGYVTVARERGFVDKSQPAESLLNRENAAEMIYNTLFVAPMIGNYISDIFVPDEYITITSSEITEDSGSIVTSIFEYDIHKKELNRIYDFNYSAQYPLGCYDKLKNTVYFTKRVDSNDYGDQIFSINLKTMKEIQLTNDLFAVNYILSDSGKVFFVGRPKNCRVLKLGCIDLAKGTINYWSDDDTNIEAIALDRKNKKVIVSAYSENERAYNVLHQDGPPNEDNMKMPKHSVYEINYDFSDGKRLFGDNMWIRTVMVHGKNVYGLCDRKYNNSAEPSYVYRYDRNDNLLYTSQWNSYRLQVGDAAYTSDGKHIFSIATVDEKRGIYDFDLKTGSVNPIMIQSKNFINNIQVVN